MKRKALVIESPESESHVHLSMMTHNQYAIGTASTTSRKYRRWIERQRRKGNSCEFDLSPQMVTKR